MSVIIDGGAGVTFPDTVQQTNGITNTGGEPPYYAARAWVIFDGTVSPPTILGGQNIASVSRPSTGVYTITFTEPMPDANYALFGATNSSADVARYTVSIVSQSAGSAQIRCGSATTSGVNNNCSIVSAVFFR